jgi:LmbE family N-acetylglucosaminyl deacetylase
MSLWPESERVLAVFPHPDDEMPLIFSLGQRDPARTALVWLHSTRRRRAESLSVLTAQGLGDAFVRFGEFPDGRMALCVGEMADWLREVGESFRPDRVVLPAFEQGHMDHDSGHVAGRLAFDIPADEYPLYHAYGDRLLTVNTFAPIGGPERRRILTARERRRKRWLLRAYRSQRVALHGDLFHALSLVRVRSQSPFRQESVRAVTHASYDLPAHRSVRVAQISLRPAWRAWLSAVPEELRASAAMANLRFQRP